MSEFVLGISGGHVVLWPQDLVLRLLTGGFPDHENDLKRSKSTNRKGILDGSPHERHRDAVRRVSSHAGRSRAMLRLGDVPHNHGVGSLARPSL